MRLVSLLVLLALSVSCGKDGGGSGGASSSSTAQNNDSCDLNGRAVACESIRGADGQGIDLLESMIDVPVKITDADIQFLADKTSATEGRRISCQTQVKNGEIYRFALRGNTLVMMTGEGSYEMKRLNSGSGLVGTWIWKGYVEEGTHIIRQMTFLGSSRVIMRTSCEL